MTIEHGMSDAELLDLAEKVFRDVKPLSPEAKARVAERTKHLLPGEDLLHYDVDRVYPPAAAGPSDVVEQAVQAVPVAAKTRPGSRKAAKRQNGGAVPGALEPRVVVPKKTKAPQTVQIPQKAFVVMTVKQARAQADATRKRRRRMGVMVGVALLAMGGVAMAWAYIERDVERAPDGLPSVAPRAPRAARAAPERAAPLATPSASAMAPKVPAPAATAAAVAPPAETTVAPSAPLSLRPTMPMKRPPKPSFVSPPPVAPAPAAVTAEPTVAPVPVATATAEPETPPKAAKPPAPKLLGGKRW